MKILGALIVILGCSIANSAPLATSGSARCTESTASNPSACYVEWTWDEQPPAYQWVQVMDPTRGTWRTIAEIPASRTGRANEPLQEGNIYRLRSCDEGDAETGCIDSTVFWSTYQPKEEEIPFLAVDSHGVVHSVSKNLPYYSQLTALNLLRLREWFYEVSDRSKLPLMTLPLRPFGAKGWTPWDNLAQNVYEFYQGSRLPQPEEKTGPGTALVIDYIGDVPESEHSKFRASKIHGLDDRDTVVFDPPSTRYNVTVFADVGCVHCQKLVLNDMDELMKMGIRVRLVAFPLGGETSPEAKTMTEIWCAKDRKETFKKAARKEPLGPSSCSPDNVTYLYALGRQLGLQMSPSIISDDGELLGGYLAPKALLLRLEEQQTAASIR